MASPCVDNFFNFSLRPLRSLWFFENESKNDYFHSALGSHIYQGLDYYNFEVIQMDLFWSGLARRAAEYTTNERRSQFSKVHEIAIRELETKNHANAV